MATKMAGLGMALQKPRTLLAPIILADNDEGNAFTLTTVNTSDDVFKEICIDFENADMTVVKIERLMNSHLWKRYDTERSLIIQQRANIDPDFQLNEKYLYHGTSVPKSIICEEGLDSRMSKQGCYGRGVYFSDYPRKCIKYAEKGENAASFILLARVILGTPKVFAKGQKDRALVREPEKSAPYKGYRFYDSVEGCPTNHKEFVVYESRRALVECIITYTKKNKSVPVSLGATTVKNHEDLNDLDSDFSDSDNDSRTGRMNAGDQESASSDDEDNNENTKQTDGYGGKRKKPESDSSDLLDRKRAEFKKKTGVTEEYVVDRYLLKGNMNVSQAVRLYKERATDVSSDEEEPPVKSKLELEIEETAKRPEHPTPGSQEWTALSYEDQEAIIKSLVEDFLCITGLTEDDGYARRCLSAVDYNLDLAVIAHYEEMSGEADYA